MDEDRINDTLKLVGLDGYNQPYPYELSGGQQQRVAIARALYSNPKIIFADEPTGNLDSTSSAKIMELFHKINEEQHTTIIMVTHSEKYASFGNRQIHIVDGILC